MLITNKGKIKGRILLHKDSAFNEWVLRYLNEVGRKHTI